MRSSEAPHLLQVKVCFPSSVQVTSLVVFPSSHAWPSAGILEVAIAVSAEASAKYNPQVSQLQNSMLPSFVQVGSTAA